MASESTTIATREFDVALSNFLKTLSPKEKAEFQPTTIGDVYKEMERIQKGHEKDGCLRYLRRIAPFIDGMMASTHIQSFDILLDALRKIGENLPRFDSFAAIFEQKPRFVEVLGWLYSDILEFYSEFLKYFRMKGRVAKVTSFDSDIWLTDYSAWKQLIAIMWAKFDHQFADIVNRINRHTALVDSEATAAHFAEARQFRINARLAFDEARKDREKRALQGIIEWLSPISFEAEFQRCEDNYCTNTGQWFFQNGRFTNWLDHSCPEKNLWLKGIPGAGKTILSYIGMNHARVRLLPTGSAVIGMFLSDRIRDKLAPTTVLRTLIYNILEADQLLLHVLDEIRDSPSSNFRSLQKLEDHIKDLLLKSEKLAFYLFLDGVDELDDQDRKKLMKILLRLSTDSSLKLLISCRPVADMEDLLSSCPQIVVNQNNEHDIETYIMSEQPALMDLFPIGGAEVEKILRPILLRAEGMFLFARLVIYNLKDQTSIAELREAAINLPHGLGEAYERILTRIDKKLGPNMRLTAREILEFLSCSRRSPRLAEIKHALTIRVNDTCFNKNQILMRSLLEICGPIIEIRDGFVYWVHFTAKE
ncbi:hypothetical protein FGG08_001099 [Glutinoglossum americanum]|uniref:NACHT domain-containing protein n=1 Tax=Glutinoglossum americanum TaxID=1670608 RepID=A0A9P8IFB1_9PEZI|nr:hypothetical protein FGG08_001099 [Glutinoglossum americanum]